MNKYLRLTLITGILVVISIILYITGKRHDITLINNLNNTIKYSVEGDKYKSLSANKKAKFYLKGKRGTVFIKNGNKVYNIDVKMDINGNYYFYVKEAIKGENFLVINEEVEIVPEETEEVKNTDDITIPNN